MPRLTEGLTLGEISKFQRELSALINKHSLENASDTPDFILANYLWDCLGAFHRATNARELHAGRRKSEVGD